MPSKQEMRLKRRQEAEERQKKYDAMSNFEKIKIAQGRRGESKKEIARLMLDGKKK